MLVRDGRLRVLATAAGDLQFERKEVRADTTTRDPSLLLDLMLSALER